MSMTPFMKAVKPIIDRFMKQIRESAEARAWDRELDKIESHKAAGQGPMPKPVKSKSLKPLE